MASHVSRWVRSHPGITITTVIGLVVLASLVWTILARGSDSWVIPG